MLCGDAKVYLAYDGKYQKRDWLLTKSDHFLFFATSKPNPPAGGWHTGFSLAGSGEYLALVKLDGLTLVSEFLPAYPPQREDISYGFEATGGAAIFYGSDSRCG